MPFLMTHFFEGGTAEQYDVLLAALHPDEELPPGRSQVLSAPSPTAGSLPPVVVTALGTVATTTFGAVAHLVPVLGPLVAPGERAPARGADFFGEVTLTSHSSHVWRPVPLLARRMRAVAVGGDCIRVIRWPRTTIQPFRAASRCSVECRGE